MQPTEKKIAFITGASRGIGEAIALGFANAGYIVIGTATTPEGADKITHILAKQACLGTGLVLNVASPESIEQAIETVKQQFGNINILVNNAAITQDNLLMRMRWEEWDATMNTNLNSIFRVTKACLRDMLKARWGRIINIGSVVGTTGNSGQVNYAATKAGMIGFTKSLASEIATRNITVNAVSPGFIQTDMTQGLPEDHKNQLLKAIPMQRLGAPSEIADAVLFLASNAAAYITGQTLHVNGGMYMNS